MIIQCKARGFVDMASTECSSWSSLSWQAEARREMCCAGVILVEQNTLLLSSVALRLSIIFKMMTSA